jgi:hypothetical protein
MQQLNRKQDTSEMFYTQIVYYIHEFCRCRIIRIMKFSRIIKMAVLMRYISQEILQYVLIQILTMYKIWQG